MLGPVGDVNDDIAEEVHLVARGIATAVAPESGLTDVQADLLEAIASALTGVEVDYRTLEPLGPDELADTLAGRDLGYRQRIVHHMVLGELVLRPIPTVVAHRVATYAAALGVEDRLRARRAALRAGRVRPGVDGPAAQRLRRPRPRRRRRRAGRGHAGARRAPDPFEPARVDADLAARWAAFEHLPAGTLGRSRLGAVRRPRLRPPGTPGGASEYLAQHDFVHVLADYGTNLKGELEVFAFIGRADPDPKGFAWLATLIGLFETGYISSTGFFDRNVQERSDPGAGHAPTHRRRDPSRQGGVRALRCRPLRGRLLPSSSVDPSTRCGSCSGFRRSRRGALAGGSAGLFDLEGMSEMQRRAAARRRGELA